MSAPAGKPYLYLHGFASSPLAAKGVDFARRLGEHGIALQRPDLNAPSFSGLTLSAQLAVVEAATDDRPAVVIGSSMGALVALLFARRHPERVARLLLLAPALGFVGGRLAAAVGASLEQWERQGHLDFPHPSDGRLHPVSFALVQDARRHDFASLEATAPTMIVHGTNDELIPASRSQAWSQSRPELRLELIEGGDHGLVAHMDEIWERTRDFLLAP